MFSNRCNKIFERSFQRFQELTEEEKKMAMVKEKKVQRRPGRKISGNSLIKTFFGDKRTNVMKILCQVAKDNVKPDKILENRLQLWV